MAVGEHVPPPLHVLGLRYDVIGVLLRGDEPLVGGRQLQQAIQQPSDQVKREGHAAQIDLI
eukprot:1360296-Pyramimonas_sp.AAC.1